MEIEEGEGEDEDEDEEDAYNHQQAALLQQQQ